MTTINDIESTEEWQSLVALTGIAAGTEMHIQYKGYHEDLVLSEGTQPAPESIRGRLLTDLARDAIIDAGSDEYWIRTKRDECDVHVEAV